MSAPKLSARQREALAAIAAHGKDGVRAGKGGVDLRAARALAAAGFVTVERRPLDSRSRATITDAGRAALRETEAPDAAPR